MTAAALLLAASLLRFLDPWTSLYQTDDDAEGARLAADPGYWPVPNGLADPLAEHPRPRVIHSCFRFAAPEDAAAASASAASQISELFKVNQVGYLPWAPKFAYLGAWLGPEYGPWEPREPLPPWELADAATGATVYAPGVPPRLSVADATSKDGTPFTGEITYEMDFSQVTREGEYFIRIPGVGRSHPFRIAGDAALDAFRVHMLGLYHKRCGIAKEEPWTHWTSGACHTNVVRGSFPPEEGTLSPKVRWFEIIRDNTPWDAGKRLALSGGWHDAADYDRRPAHLNIVGDLCAVYLMRPDNFTDSQLRLPERANGIPDILDEAEWGLRHLLAAQLPNGGVGTWIETTRHPVPGSVAERDDLRYALSRATRRSSLAYAAHAALLARTCPAFRDKYLESAKRAWNFALAARPQSDIFEIRRRRLRFFYKSEIVEWDEDARLPSRELVKAAINLFALTLDERYFAAVQAAKEQVLHDVKHEAWKWPPLSFSGELALGLPVDSPAWQRSCIGEFLEKWRTRTLSVARSILDQTSRAYAYRAPWWAPREGWVASMSWGQCHPLRRAQYLVAAHGFGGNDAPAFLEAASLANDFHNGCNPQGSTLTSGLGRSFPVAFLDLPSYVDGIAEYVPGITPYRWNYGIPPKVVELVFGGDKALASRWPVWRRWGNLENQTVAASEYTVWETIAPAASVTGYLIAGPDARPPAQPRQTALPPLREPARSLQSLPGYWPLP